MPDTSDLMAPVRVAYPEQGWALLRNGVIVFDDGGALLPTGEVIEPHSFAA